MAKRKQAALPGMERDRDEELDAAAEDVQEADKKRSKAQELGDERRGRLIELMKKRGLSTYVSEDKGLRVDLKAGEIRVSVKKWEPPPEGDEGDEGEQAAAE